MTLPWPAYRRSRKRSRWERARRDTISCQSPALQHLPGLHASHSFVLKLPATISPFDLDPDPCVITLSGTCTGRYSQVVCSLIQSAIMDGLGRFARSRGSESDNMATQHEVANRLLYSGYAAHIKSCETPDVYIYVWCMYMYVLEDIYICLGRMTIGMNMVHSKVCVGGFLHKSFHSPAFM